jgi:hypothetical protein
MGSVLWDTLFLFPSKIDHPLHFFWICKSVPQKNEIRCFGEFDRLFGKTFAKGEKKYLVDVAAKLAETSKFVFLGGTLSPNEIKKEAAPRRLGGS